MSNLSLERASAQAENNSLGAIKNLGHLFTERGLQAAAARTMPAVLRPEGAWRPPSHAY
jgi:hypothetical protein